MPKGQISLELFVEQVTEALPFVRFVVVKFALGSDQMVGSLANRQQLFLNCVRRVAVPGSLPLCRAGEALHPENCSARIMQIPALYFLCVLIASTCSLLNVRNGSGAWRRPQVELLGPVCLPSVVDRGCKKLGVCSAKALFLSSEENPVPEGPVSLRHEASK